MMSALCAVGVLMQYMYKKGTFLHDVIKYVGIFAAVLAILFYATIMDESVERAMFLIMLMAPGGIYLMIVLSTPLTEQIRLYWLPFVVMAVITLVLIMWTTQTH